MTRFFALFILALAALGAQADPREDFREAVRNHQIEVDHIATIGRWKYEIYVNRAIDQPIALAIITKESWEQVFGLPESTANKVIAEQAEKVRVYIDSISGVAREPQKPKKPTKAEEWGPTGCPEYFQKEYRDTRWMAGFDWIYIDPKGRPAESWIQWDSPPVAAPRDKGCQQKVGYMGRPTGDEGGHLVAASLGGWGGRANLTPQNASLNRTLFAPAERAVLYCASLPNVLVSWLVQARYDDALEVTPRPASYYLLYQASVAQCPPQWNHPYTPCASGVNGCRNEIPTAADYAQLNYFKEVLRQQCNDISGGGLVPQDWPCDGP